MQNTRLVSCKKRGFSIFMKTEVHIDMDGFLRSSLLTHRMTLQISLHPIRGTLLLRVNDKCIPLDQICYIFVVLQRRPRVGAAVEIPVRTYRSMRGIDKEAVPKSSSGEKVDFVEIGQGEKADIDIKD